MNERAAKGGGVIHPLDLPTISVRYNSNDIGFFGPSKPMAPQAQEAQGRAWDYPVAFNLNIKPRHTNPINFATLRALAKNYDLLRLAIETRKDQMCALKWRIAINEEVPALPKQQERLAALTEFYKRPDRQTRWQSWLRAVIEEVLVTDALAFWPQRTYNGTIYALNQIDGATIKPVLEYGGRVPMGGQPAYQQILKGLPAVDYQAHSTYSRDTFTPTALPELIYAPRNKPIHDAYGFSPVEQILSTVNLALNRQTYQTGYFTTGNMPESIITAPEGWTNQMITEFQNYWDSLIAGEVAEKRRTRFVTHGMDYKPTKTEELFGKAEEWLARVVCYAFSLSPQAFSPQMNRATAETAATTAEDEGLIPLRIFIEELFNDFNAVEFYSPDLMFVWDDRSKLPEKTARELNLAEYEKGLVTKNEARKRAHLAVDPNDPQGNEYKSAPAVAPPPVGGGNALLGAPQGGEDGGDAEPKEENIGVEKLAKGHICGAGCDHGAPVLAKADTDGHALSCDRKAARRIRHTIIEELTPLLQKMGDKAAGRATKLLRKTLKKADGDAAPEDLPPATWEALLAGWTGPVQDMIDSIMDDLQAMAADTAKTAVELITYDNFDKVNEAAVKLMAEHGAALVTDITESTRNMLRQTIAKGLADNIGLPAIAESIQDAYAFSPARADIIARTEISWANSNTSLLSYQMAKADGLAVKKGWLLGPNPCPTCQANADQGAIELEEAFQSGHQCPTAHPNCECALTPVIDV